jgi:ABC-2 type transport system ATP-binding protein
MMIEVNEVTKRYGQATAVSGLSFVVRPGRVTGFLGPNGAGKSTTIRMILGLDAPTTGTVTIDGRAYTSLRRPMHQVGALLDATAVPGARSAHHHLRALAQSNGIGRARVAEVLAEVGLGQVAGKRVGGFSLGMKQRLGIAAALLGDPEVLLFDEPVNGLDPEGIRWIRGLFRELAGQGRTVLVSSHLMNEMAATADHLIVIGRGRLVADTSTADLVAHAGPRQVAVRTPQRDELIRILVGAGAEVHPGQRGELEVSGLDADRIGELAHSNGLALHELTTRAASLEEAFLRLTAETVEYHASPAAPGTPAGHLIGTEHRR